LLNRKAKDVLGISDDDGVGINWFDACIPSYTRAQISGVFRSLLTDRGSEYTTLQSPIIGSDGSERLIAWSNVVLRADEQGDVIGLLSSGTDITDVFHTTAALETSQQQLDEMKYALDQASIVAITDVKGRITYVNDKFCEISRYTAEELLGQDHRILNSGHHGKAFMKNLWTTIARGKVWRGEILNRRKDGGHYWVDTTIVPFVGQTGRPYQYVSIRTDITNRKRTEKALRESTALARLGEMASVVAHEVKNPLAGIGGALQVIVRRMEEGSAERMVIGDILKRIELLNDTMEDLLDYARPRNLRVSEVNVEDLLHSVQRQVEADPRFGDVTLEVACEPDGHPLRVPLDERHMAAALLNLAINAAQSMRSGGKVRLSGRVRGDMCELMVSDNGPGIPEELRAKIFEPFFTTRHQGTGLGLAIVQQTAVRHGGEARLHCPDAGGTEVVIAIPRAR
ncbi:MAG: PAS domain S-box protein, partial [Myxococcales bacterium]|nr:PAS domain S-box protein [Myxococcales bacterium]